MMKAGTKILTIILLVITLGVVFYEFSSPSKENTDETTQKASDNQDSPSAIGPQFWLYDLSSFERVGHDVVSGPGGRWISVKYRKKPNAVVTRQELVAQITSALTADGWSKKPRTRVKYVFSKIWEQSKEDIYFTREAREGEPKHWFFAQTIHVNATADLVCLYCEVGW